MSTSQTTTGLAPPRWSTKAYAALLAATVALALGAFAAYSLSTSEPAASTGSITSQVEVDRSGGGGCTANHAVSGGLVEGQTVNDTCDNAVGPRLEGGIQP